MPRNPERPQVDRSHWPGHAVSLDEADELDFEFYESLTPQQRLDIMAELVGRLQHGADNGLNRHALVDAVRPISSTAKL
ncbi:hypothetical protein BH11ARM1_BH11ARM1_15630 [soil metagenome]